MPNRMGASWTNGGLSTTATRMVMARCVKVPGASCLPRQLVVTCGVQGALHALRIHWCRLFMYSLCGSLSGRLLGLLAWPPGLASWLGLLAWCCMVDLVQVDEHQTGLVLIKPDNMERPSSLPGHIIDMITTTGLHCRGAKVM